MPEVRDDVLAVLVRQHEQVRSLFAELLEGRATDRGETFQCLVRLLSVHEVAEEEVLWPAVRRYVDGGDTLADERVAEEDQAKTLLAELERIGVDGDGFDARLRAFQQVVEAHASAEEQTAFAELAEVQSAEQRERLAVALAAAEAMAPTHPHPHGPSSAIGNLMVGPAVMMVDRARDAIRRALGS